MSRLDSNESFGHRSYMYNRAMSSTDGLGTSPANPYSIAEEYGPAATDMHHRVLAGRRCYTQAGYPLQPHPYGDTGPPYDITVGRDLYGDTLFNGRPGIATDPTKPGGSVAKRR